MYITCLRISVRRVTDRHTHRHIVYIYVDCLFLVPESATVLNNTYLMKKEVCWYGAPLVCKGNQKMITKSCQVLTYTQEV